MTIDSQRNLMEKRDARLGVSVEDAIAEIEALKAPAEPEPVTVAEFARTSETRQALGDVLPPDELAALDSELELHEAMADFDLTGDDPKPTMPDPARLELVRRTRDELVADALANGWRAQACREIDQYRAGPGREARNAKQCGDYASMIWETEGRAVRTYVKNPTPEHRRDQKAASKANRSPEQIERERVMDSARKAKKRQAEREAKAAALKDGA